MINEAGLSTALEESTKCGEGQREKPEISKNFQLPLLAGDESFSVSDCPGGNISVCTDSNGVELEALSDQAGTGLDDCAAGNAEELRLQEEDAEADIDCNYQTSRRSVGRPKGSRNRSTEAWRSFFLRQNKSPLMFLGGIYSVTTQQLSKDMSIDKEDALKYQIAAAQAVLPYIHQKQPIALERADDVLPIINITMTKNEMQVMTNSKDGQLKPEYRKIELISDQEFQQIAAEDVNFEIISDNK